MCGLYEEDKTSGGTVTGTKTYYPAAGAMRVGSTLYYVLKNHLGSASVVTDHNGVTLTSGGEQRYFPYGESRLASGITTTDKLFTGQREITGLGIYHYGARFYSPKLGRFLSPDTIVPGYANPQNLDRYTYTSNNPLRYSDPSGHKVCDGEGINGDCDQSGIPSTLGQVSISLRSYGVRLRRGTAQWTFNDAYAAYLGVSAVGSALSRVSGQEATAIFRHAFGPMTFTMRNDIGYFGIASDGNIDFQAGRVTARLTAHELGHSFEKHMYANNGNVFADDHPVMMLIRNGIFVDGQLITGNGEGNRYNGLRAPDNGYICDSYIGECQYHSRDVGDLESWNNEYEDWADIFMNWTYGSFAPNPAGDALYNWVETNMVTWLR